MYIKHRVLTKIYIRNIEQLYKSSNFHKLSIKEIFYLLFCIDVICLIYFIYCVYKLYICFIYSSTFEI